MSRTYLRITTFLTIIQSRVQDLTKSLKSVVIDWISPPGQSLGPPLARNIKADRAFNHDRTGFLLCPAGLDWTNPECVP
jgi:hypothetical protein